MNFKLKLLLLIRHYYKVHFLKVYLSVLNTHESVHSEWPFISLMTLCAVYKKIIIILYQKSKAQVFNFLNVKKLFNMHRQD